MAAIDHNVPRLFYVFMPGCGACAEMKPIVAEWKKAHPEVRVVAIDLTAVEWKPKNWMPEATPTMIAVRNRKWSHIVGVTPKDEFEAWAAKHLLV